MVPYIRKVAVDNYVKAIETIKAQVHESYMYMYNNYNELLDHSVIN